MPQERYKENFGASSSFEKTNMKIAVNFVISVSDLKLIFLGYCN